VASETPRNRAKGASTPPVRALVFALHVLGLARRAPRTTTIFLHDSATSGRCEPLDPWLLRELVRCDHHSAVTTCRICPGRLRHAPFKMVAASLSKAPKWEHNEVAAQFLMSQRGGSRSGPLHMSLQLRSGACTHSYERSVLARPDCGTGLKPVLVHRRLSSGQELVNGGPRRLISCTTHCVGPPQRWFVPLAEVGSVWDCDAAPAATSCMPPVCIGLNRRNQIAIAIPKALITAIAQDAAESPTPARPRWCCPRRPGSGRRRH